jgi:glycosyltransferase involved in cell wall biosynthesis
MSKNLIQNKRKNLISIIIPLFNEGEHFKQTFSLINQEVQASSISKKLDVKYEYILIDDGSFDNTWIVICDLKKQYHGKEISIKGISFSKNFGKDAAISAGLSNCLGDCAIVLDADLQHPPNLIVLMIKSWLKDKYMLIEANKIYNSENSGFIRRIFSSIFYDILFRFSGVDIRNSSDYKLIDRKAIDTWLTLKERSIFFRGTIAWLGFKSKKINFIVGKRSGGKSGWGNLKLLKLAISSLSSFSNLPLYLVPIIGLIFIIFSVILACWILYLKFTMQIASGFTTLILINLITGGCIMIGLGIIGQYLGKIYDELKGRPRFVVERKI